MMGPMETLMEIERLLAVFYTPEEEQCWWSSPQPRFEGITPAQMVDDGRADEILQSLRQLDECVYL